MPLRKLTEAEEGFLQFMIEKAKLKMKEDWKLTIRAAPMDEGGMGSLVLFPNGTQSGSRSFGRTAAEYEFKDADRATVVASLNLDQAGELFELDIWKTTFEPLIRFPETEPNSQ